MASTSKDETFTNFISEVKEIEKRDSVLTSQQQIDRLLRPGSSYLNLNPFEVLQLEPETPVDQIKKKYRSLSILVHPDKNQDNKERAENAFEAVNRAWKILENDMTRKKCLDLYEEAKDRTDLMVSKIGLMLWIALRALEISDCGETKKIEEIRANERNLNSRRRSSQIQACYLCSRDETIRGHGTETTTTGPTGHGREEAEAGAGDRSGGADQGR